MISYREALKKEFPQLTDKMIDKSGCYCPGNFFSGENVPHYAECEEATNEEICSKCWDKPCEGTYNGEPFDPSDWEDNADNAAAVPALSETAVFDYSELDADVACKLRKAAENVIAAKRKYVFEVAEQVKIAHDLLANNRNGMFGAWCESVGISRFTGKNLLNIVELFNNITPEQTANLEQLKPYMLYEISKPSAPPELVEQVMNGDITTHKDYIKLKKQLEETTKRAELAEENEKNAHEGFKRVDEASRENLMKYREEHEKVNQLEAEIHRLEKEAKNRPVEVAVQPDEKALAEKDKEIISLQSKIAEQQETIKDMNESFNDYVAITDQKTSDLKAQISALESTADSGSGKGFFIAATTQEFADLLTTVGKSCGKTSRAYAILAKAHLLTLK